MSVNKTAWVITGDGINCEEETAYACKLAGFKTTIIHFSELLKSPRKLDDCSLLVIPGGFSFGDELGSGRVFALKLKYQLGWDLPAFARDGGLVLGICNGFQVLVALGVFGEGVALAHNESGRFINQWVELKAERSRAFDSPYLKGIAAISLPIRHGEGRLLVSSPSQVGSSFTPCLFYENNPNGSLDSIAGITDPTGRIFGLMPHPEAFIRGSQHPGFFRNEDRKDTVGDGFKIFENAFKGARSL